MDTIILGLSIPFLGTLLGSATVFLLKDKMSSRLQKMLLGFASGVMIAASVWSLLIPAIEVSEEKFSLPWLPPAAQKIGSYRFLLNAFFDLSSIIIPVFWRKIKGTRTKSDTFS